MAYVVFNQATRKREGGGREEALPSPSYKK